MINNMSEISLDQLQREIKSNHQELIEKLELFGLVESKIINMIVPWQVQKYQPDFIQLTKIFKEGKISLLYLGKFLKLKW